MSVILGELVIDCILDTQKVRDGFDDIYEYGLTGGDRLQSIFGGLKPPSPKDLHLAPTVDLSGLHELNRVFDQKGEHHDRLQDKFDASPLTPRVDSSGLDLLSQKMAKVQSQFDALSFSKQITATSRTEAMDSFRFKRKRQKRNSDSIEALEADIAETITEQSFMLDFQIEESSKQSIRKVSNQTKREFESAIAEGFKEGTKPTLIGKAFKVVNFTAGNVIEGMLTRGGEKAFDALFGRTRTEQVIAIAPEPIRRAFEDGMNGVSDDLSIQISKGVADGMKESQKKSLFDVAFSSITTTIDDTLTGFNEAVGASFGQQVGDGMIMELESSLDLSFKKMGQKRAKGLIGVGSVAAKGATNLLGIDAGPDGELKALGNAANSLIDGAFTKFEAVTKWADTATQIIGDQFTLATFKLGDGIIASLEADGFQDKFQAFFKASIDIEGANESLQKMTKELKRNKLDLFPEPTKEQKQSLSPIGRVIDSTLRTRREKGIEQRAIPLVLDRTEEILGSKRNKNTGKVVDESTKELFIATGGYANARGLSGARIAKDLAKTMGDDQKIIWAKNTDTDIKKKGQQQYVQSLAKPNLRGFSLDSVEMAAQAMAALEKNPEITIKFLGESGGGFAAEEAYKILQSMGVKNVDFMGVGTPELAGSLTPGAGKKLISPDETLGREAHWLASHGVGDVTGAQQQILGVKSHPIEGYLEAQVPELMAFLGRSIGEASVEQAQQMKADAQTFFDSIGSIENRSQRDEYLKAAVLNMNLMKRYVIHSSAEASQYLEEAAQLFENALVDLSPNDADLTIVEGAVNRAKEVYDEIRQQPGKESKKIADTALDELLQLQQELKDRSQFKFGISGIKADRLDVELNEQINRFSNPHLGLSRIDAPTVDQHPVNLEAIDPDVARPSLPNTLNVPDLKEAGEEIGKAIATAFQENIDIGAIGETLQQSFNVERIEQRLTNIRSAASRLNDIGGSNTELTDIYRSLIEDALSSLRAEVDDAIASIPSIQRMAAGDPSRLANLKGQISRMQGSTRLAGALPDTPGQAARAIGQEFTSGVRAIRSLGPESTEAKAIALQIQAAEQQAREALANLETALADDIEPTVQRIISAAKGSITRAINIISNDLYPDGVDIGDNFVQGINQGIEEAIADARAIAQQLAADIVDSTKDEFEIESPSKKGLAIGKNFANAIVSAIQAKIENLPSIVGKVLLQAADQSVKASEAIIDVASETVVDPSNIRKAGKGFENSTGRNIVGVAASSALTGQLPEGAIESVVRALIRDAINNPTQAIIDGFRRQETILQLIANSQGKQTIAIPEVMRDFAMDNEAAKAAFKEAIVNTAGLGASVAAGPVGIPAAIAADIGTALVSRKVVSDIEAFNMMIAQIGDNAEFASNRLKLYLKAVEMAGDFMKSDQGKQMLAEDLSGDAVGGVIGNAAAAGLQAAGSSIPLQGAVVAMLSTGELKRIPKDIEEGEKLVDASLNALKRLVQKTIKLAGMTQVAADVYQEAIASANFSIESERAKAIRSVGVEPEQFNDIIMGNKDIEEIGEIAIQAGTFAISNQAELDEGIASISAALLNMLQVSLDNAFESEKFDFPDNWLINGIKKGLDKFGDRVDTVAGQYAHVMSEAFEAIAPDLFEKMKAGGGDGADALPEGEKAVIPEILPDDLALPFDEAIAIIEEKRKTLWERLKDILSRIYRFGKNIVQGLVNGLMSGVDWVKSAALTTGQTFIGIFKSIFQIESPSKVMIGIGENIVQGFLVGLKGLADIDPHAIAQSALDGFNNVKDDALETARELLNSDVGQTVKNSAQQGIGIAKDVSTSVGKSKLGKMAEARVQETAASMMNALEETIANESAKINALMSETYENASDSAAIAAKQSAIASIEILDTLSTKVEQSKEALLSAPGEGAEWEDSIRQQIERIGSSIDGLKERVSDLNNNALSNIQIPADANPIETLSASTETLGEKLKKISLAVVGFVASFKLLEFVKNNIGDLLKDSIQTAIEFQRLETTLKFVTGSASAAADQIARISSESKRLGTDSFQSIQGYAQLASATRGTSLEGYATSQISAAIQQAGAVSQIDQQQIEQANTAITQIAGKGKLSSEELRQQLSEVGGVFSGSMQIAGRAIGADPLQLEKMLKQGKILSEDFLPKFAQQLASETAAGVAGASKTAQASINRFNNSLGELQATAGKQLLPARQIGLEIAANAMEKVVGIAPIALQLLSAISIKLGVDVVRSAIIASGWLDAIKLKLIGVNASGGMKGLIAGFQGAAKSALIFGKTMLKAVVPYVAIFGLIETVGILKHSFSDLSGELGGFTDEAKRGFNAYADAVAKATGNVDELSRKLPQLRSEIKGDSLFKGSLIESIIGEKGGHGLEAVLTQVVAASGVGVVSKAFGRDGIRSFAERQAEQEAIARNELFSQINQSLSASYGPDVQNAIAQVTDIDDTLSKLQAQKRNVNSASEKEAIGQQIDELLQRRQDQAGIIGALQGNFATERQLLEETIKDLEAKAASGAIDESTYNSQRNVAISQLEDLADRQDFLTNSVKASVSASARLAQEYERINAIAEDSKLALEIKNAQRQFDLAIASTGQGGAVIERLSTDSDIESIKSQLAINNQQMMDIAASLEENSVVNAFEVLAGKGITQNMGASELLQALENEAETEEIEILRQFAQQSIELESLKAETIGLDADLVQSRNDLKQQARDLAIQYRDLSEEISDFYRDAYRSAEDVANTIASQDLQNATQEISNSIQRELIGLEESFVSGIADTFTGLIESLRQPLLEELDAINERNGIQREFEDSMRAARDMQRQADEFDFEAGFGADPNANLAQAQAIGTGNYLLGDNGKLWPKVIDLTAEQAWGGGAFLGEQSYENTSHDFTPVQAVAETNGAIADVITTNLRNNDIAAAANLAAQSRDEQLAAIDRNLVTQADTASLEVDRAINDIARQLEEGRDTISEQSDSFARSLRDGFMDIGDANPMRELERSLVSVSDQFDDTNKDLEAFKDGLHDTIAETTAVRDELLAGVAAGTIGEDALGILPDLDQTIAESQAALASADAQIEQSRDLLQAQRGQIIEDFEKAERDRRKAAQRRMVEGFGAIETARIANLKISPFRVDRQQMQERLSILNQAEQDSVNIAFEFDAELSELNQMLETGELTKLEYGELRNNLIGLNEIKLDSIRNQFESLLPTVDSIVSALSSSRGEFNEESFTQIQDNLRLAVQSGALSGEQAQEARQGLSRARNIAQTKGDNEAIRTLLNEDNAFTSQFLSQIGRGDLVGIAELGIQNREAQRVQRGLRDIETDPQALANEIARPELAQPNIAASEAFLQSSDRMVAAMEKLTNTIAQSGEGKGSGVTIGQQTVVVSREDEQMERAVAKKFNQLLDQDI